MTMNVFQNEGIAVVVPGVQRLDASVADGFRTTLKSAMDSGSNALVLDLESVNLVDSTILGVVVGTFRDLPEGRSLVLCTVSENVASLLHLTHLDRILSVYTSREEAVAALAH
jgi:anti-sigma B factor antagonist